MAMVVSSLKMYYDLKVFKNQIKFINLIQKTIGIECKLELQINNN